MARNSTGVTAITGNFYSAVNFGCGILTPLSADANGYTANRFIAALDANGQCLWSKILFKQDHYIWPSYGTDVSGDWTPKLAVDSQGNIYIAAGFSGNLWFDTGGSGTTLSSGVVSTGSSTCSYASNPPDRKLYRIKFSTTGSILWANVFGLNGVFTGSGTGVCDSSLSTVQSVAIDNLGSLLISYQSSYGSTNVSTPSHCFSNSLSYPPNLNGGRISRVDAVSGAFVSGLDLRIYGATTNVSVPALAVDPITNDVLVVGGVTSRCGGTGNITIGSSVFSIDTTYPTTFVARIRADFASAAMTTFRSTNPAVVTYDSHDFRAAELASASIAVAPDRSVGVAFYGARPYQILGTNVQFPILRMTQALSPTQVTAATNSNIEALGFDSLNNMHVYGTAPNNFNVGGGPTSCGSGTCQFYSTYASGSNQPTSLVSVGATVPNSHPSVSETNGVIYLANLFDDIQFHSPRGATQLNKTPISGLITKLPANYSNP